jgi:hypothetical protein
MTIITMLLFIFLLCQCDNLQSIYEIKKPNFSIEIKNNYYEVRMSAGSNGVIFYTLDGSIPTNDSSRYGGSIAVQPGTNIKAVSYCPGGRKSKISETVIDLSAAGSLKDLSNDSCQTLK